DLIDAEHVRDVEPGELLVIDGDGLRSFRPFPPEPVRQCVFEHVYFARPDSEVFGRNVLASRLALGRQLAREAPADADIVVPVPDSGIGAALGYAQESGLPYEWGLLRAVNDPDGQRHCTACFSGRYPVAVSQTEDWQLPLFEKVRS